MPLGFRPTDDPEWRHEHVNQGLVARCQRRGCEAAWPVLCHSAHRKYCPTCGRAVRRERDRASKARTRKQGRRNADAYKAHLAVMIARSKQRGPLPDLDEDEDELALEDELAEQIARLEEAQDFAAARNDAHGVRVASERLRALMAEQVFVGRTAINK